MKSRAKAVALDESGLALPLALAVTVLAFLLATAALSAYSRFLETAELDWKETRAEYAAESGVARMRQKVCRDLTWRRPLATPMNGIQTRTTVETTGKGTLEIRSVARGEGVKQTITAEVDSATCSILRWEP
ncbi:hypothetical protein C8P63_101251 [Melghirimyces profundicolus]|uniref:Uncharacterized protein n=1 Tax=Melghirimyces profundicolus TaxID=1242148 RepID=A0A2T6C9P2_9BACL|nr:hypothetical protein [Melghirimyces profundicolus]PTX65027.1 hypothetical protein C8P63_101251 [Melghirimyces profundicolus]